MGYDTSGNEFINGVIEKKGYRKRWIAYAEKDPSHPYNRGVHMDTHHLISKEAVTISELGDILVDKGYDINVIENLVGFPATLPAACHLGVQLHRGDHFHERVPGEEPYHDHVASEIKKKKKKILSCYGKTKKTEDESEVHVIVNKIGRGILKQLIGFTLPLTEMFEDFMPQGAGCKNCFDIVEARTSNEPCAKEYRHYGRDDRYQDSNANGNTRDIEFGHRNGWLPTISKKKKKK